MYNFDEIIDRQNTDAVKMEMCQDVFGTKDLLPLWVADMDFRTPDFILNAISERIKHPILGYTVPPAEFQSVIAEWIFKRHEWKIETEWIGFLTGIVPGLSFAVQIYTEKGDEIIVQPPVYFPFMNVVLKNERKLVYNPLIEKEGLLQMDFEDLEKKITKNTKMLLLCNPHNPGGRVWDEATLQKLAEICKKHQILLVSDEIHADMTFENNKHIPFAKVSDTAADLCITYMAPSKTFNMPGLISSYYIIPNPELRNKFVKFLEKNELQGGNIFAYAATMAAYKEGNEWRKQMLKYVEGNINYLIEFLQKNIPSIKVMIPQASFLVWLDCSALAFDSDDALSKFFVNEAKLGLNQGIIFGPGGENHMRLNVACSRLILEKVLNRLKTALNK